MGEMEYNLVKLRPSLALVRELRVVLLQPRGVYSVKYPATSVAYLMVMSNLWRVHWSDMVG